METNKEKEKRRREKIGVRIIGLRNKHEIMQKDLAKIIDHTSVYLSQIEKGEREVTVLILLRLFHELGWSPSFILLGVPPDEYKVKYPSQVKDNDVTVVKEPPPGYYEKPLEKMSQHELLDKQLDAKRLVKRIDEILLKSD